MPPDSAEYRRRGAYYATLSRTDLALQDFAAALRLDPKNADVHIERGLLFHRMGRFAQALTEYERAIDLDPDHGLARNNLAWMLATCPEEKFRNGPRAVELATKACEVSRYDSWFSLGTLAAAYAEIGDFEEARAWAKESMRRAPEEERLACRERFRLYKQEMPFRETPAKASQSGTGQEN